MDNWLKDHLILSGHMTETGATRTARLRRCSRCKTRVLVGLDDTRCAFEVRADPVPLSPLGEALALVEGRRTVALHREAGRYVIDWRTDHEIGKRPAGTGQREDVLRSHVCGTEVVAVLAATTSFTEARPTTVPAGSPAPF